MTFLLSWRLFPYQILSSKNCSWIIGKKMLGSIRSCLAFSTSFLMMLLMLEKKIWGREDHLNHLRPPSSPSLLPTILVPLPVHTDLCGPSVSHIIAEAFFYSSNIIFLAWQDTHRRQLKLDAGASHPTLVFCQPLFCLTHETEHALNAHFLLHASTSRAFFSLPSLKLGPSEGQWKGYPALSWQCCFLWALIDLQRVLLQEGLNSGAWEERQGDKRDHTLKLSSTPWNSPPWRQDHFYHELWRGHVVPSELYAVLHSRDWKRSETCFSLAEPCKIHPCPLTFPNPQQGGPCLGGHF